MILFAAIVVALLAGLGLFGIFFHDRRDFAICLKSFLSLSVFSVLRADYLDRWLASARLFFYLFLTASAGIGAYYALVRLLPRFLA